MLRAFYRIVEIIGSGYKFTKVWEQMGFIAYSKSFKILLYKINV
jgi:hypothetical protein